MFDPDGDQEDLWEDNGIDQPDHPDYRAGGNLVTSEAQREDVRAIAAALAPGGLAGTPLPGPAPAAMPSAVAPAFGGRTPVDGPRGERVCQYQDTDACNIGKPPSAWAC